MQIKKFVFGQSKRQLGQNISINVYYTDKLWGCLLLMNRLVIIYYHIHFKTYSIIQSPSTAIALASLWKADKLEYLGFIKILWHAARTGIIDGDNFPFSGTATQHITSNKCGILKINVARIQDSYNWEEGTIIKKKYIHHSILSNLIQYIV